jgi:hypothetical protein
MVVAGYDDLNTLLSGKRYLEFAPRQIKDAEPLGRTNQVVY